MLVRVINMQGFMGTPPTRVELPAKGLVLVTGPNGAGKSRFVEAVATAGWGKTLRGTSPWSGKGHASIITDDLDISRTHTKGGGKKLKWEPVDGDTAPAFESTTKAQAALESIIGSFDVWRRTSVFSSQDAAHFTMATDGQRKKLLEQLIGLDRFDPALAACRADKRAAEAKLNEAKALLRQLESQLENGHQRQEDAKRVLDTTTVPPDVGGLREKLDGLHKLHEAAKADVRTTENTIRTVDQAGADALSDARVLKRQLDHLGEGNCDRCGRPITDAMRAPLLDEFEQANTTAKTARAKAHAECTVLAEDLTDLREEAEALRAKGQDIDHQINAHATALRQRQAAEQAYDGACKALDGLQERINTGRGLVEELAAEAALLQAVDHVLGLKGVRAHVLGRALAGIENAANLWLNRIVGDEDPYPVIDEASEVEAAFGGPMCLRLKPYSEKKTGGVSDSISLEVIGAGGGYGYKASSGGERRRIDVSILLALAEVAQAAHGRVGGTIWADECFDALDTDGVERVSSVLAELAEERAVVVISHNSELQRALRPVVHLHVDAHGKVERRL